MNEWTYRIEESFGSNGMVIFYRNNNRWWSWEVNWFVENFPKFISSTNSDYLDYILCSKICMDELKERGLA